MRPCQCDTSFSWLDDFVLFRFQCFLSWFNCSSCFSKLNFLRVFDSLHGHITCLHVHDGRGRLSRSFWSKPLGVLSPAPSVARRHLSCIASRNFSYSCAFSSLSPITSFCLIDLATAAPSQCGWGEAFVSSTWITAEMMTSLRHTFPLLLVSLFQRLDLHFFAFTW